MITIIGLGNPGEEYTETRHNAGRNILIAFAKKEHMSAWNDDKKTKSINQKNELSGKKIFLILPETYMNKSGNTARELGIKAKNTLLVHDDSDIPLGNMKFSYGKRSGGHKGVESVKRALKTTDFWRLRIGIQKKKRISADKLVLMKFSPKESAEFKKVTAKAVKAISSFILDGPDRAMNEFNR